MHVPASATLKVKVADNGTISNVKHPMEGKIWYILGHISDNQIGCHSIEFKNGEILFNKVTRENQYKCSSQVSDVDWTYHFNAKGKMIAEPLHDEDEGYDNRVTFVKTLSGMDSGSVRVQAPFGYITLFSKPEDVEKRLKIKSNGSYQDRSFTIILPKKEDGTYQVGSVNLQVTSSSNGHELVDVILSTPNSNISCDVLDAYEPMVLVQDREIHFDGSYHNIEKGGFNACKIRFQVPKLNKNHIYNITADVKDEDGNEIVLEPILANIQWTGIGSQE